MTPTETKQNFYHNRREIFLGEIDGDHVDDVIDRLCHFSLADTQLVLVICSPGGVTSAGFRLAQFIEQELQKPVTARVWGSCNSAATYALLSCENRIAHPQSTFVLHRQTSELEVAYDGGSFEQKLAEWRASNEAIHAQQVAFYARKLGLDTDRVEEILQRGAGLNDELSAPEALDLGLITKISAT